MSGVVFIKKKIVLVDDVNFFLLSTKSRLEKFYDVYTAQSMEMLFELLEKIQPDLILLDVNMPEVDGFQTIQKLSEDERYNDIPVIFLTGRDDKASMIKGIELGAADFVVKPITEKVLREHIELQLNPSLKVDSMPIILAVDDSPSVLQTVNHALSDKYTVRTLAQPENLVQLLTKIIPDLFILDYKMPILSGFDLIQIIRSFPEHKDTPIMILTSERSIDHITAAMHLGACDFIIKPFDNDVLRKKIEAQLKNFHIRRRINEINTREGLE